MNPFESPSTEQKTKKFDYRTFPLLIVLIPISIYIALGVFSELGYDGWLEIEIETAIRLGEIQSYFMWISWITFFCAAPFVIYRRK